MIMNSVGGEMGGEEESSQSQSQSQSQSFLLLSDDERRALRGSKFAPLPPSQTLTLTQTQTQSRRRRLAHPGGPVKTNKAAALAKFLERKLQQPDGLKSLNPDLLELAVKNAKETVQCSRRGGGGGGPSTSGQRIVRHVASFEDDSEGSEDDQDEHEEIKERGKRRKLQEVPETTKTNMKQQNKKRGRRKRRKPRKM